MTGETDVVRRLRGDLARALSQLEAARADAVAVERERCARLVEGKVYMDRYREWPWLHDGNRSADQEVVIRQGLKA